MTLMNQSVSSSCVCSFFFSVCFADRGAAQRIQCYHSGLIPGLTSFGEIHMQNLFQEAAVEEVISRLDTLQPTSQRQWGKMDVAQMMAHCNAAMDMASGRLNIPRIFIGRVIGPFVKPIYTN